MSVWRRVRKAGTAVAIVAALAAALVVSAAEPAAAHGSGTVQSTNVDSEVRAVEPEIDGLEVRVIELGHRVELRNDTDREIIVLGYEGEPYLRVGPDGVEENERSPAVYINRSDTPPADVPEDYDPAAAPKWRRVSDDPVARWHDHRTHYMGSGRPPEAVDDRSTVISDWTIDLRDGSQPVVVSGQLTWVPPPSPWPWIALAAGLAIVTIFAARRWWRATMSIALVVLVAGEVVHILGAWDARVRPLLSHLGSDAYSLLAIAFGVVALIRMRRGAYAAAPWVMVTGILFVVAGGVADLDVLYRSQTPGSLTGAASRALVALALGGGTACIVEGARKLRTPLESEETPTAVT